MIRQCAESDLDAVFKNINDAAQAYRGVIKVLVDFPKTN
jgi:hypothetical protein